MRVSREQAAASRKAIVDTASRLFRERGIDGVGVADLMKEAGFTHGGFYNHFPSKEALAAEACGAAFEESLSSLTEKLGSGRKDATSALARYLEGYLSPRHRDDPNGGCPTASMAVDAWRQGSEVQTTFAKGIEDVLAVFAAEVPELTAGKKARSKQRDPAADREHAMRLLNEIVGALVLSRAVKGANPKLSDALLRASRESLDE